jgi:hypothetical protein
VRQLDHRIEIEANLRRMNSRAGFDPAPSSPVERLHREGEGGLTSDQIAAQRRLLARPVAREPKRPDAKWGRE